MKQHTGIKPYQNTVHKRNIRGEQMFENVTVQNKKITNKRNSFK